MLESYQGGPEYLFKGVDQVYAAGDRTPYTSVNDRNLFKYFKEGAEEYRDRLLRSHRNNYCKKVVDQIRAFVGRKPPLRQESKASEALRRFWDNADGKGRNIDRHMMIQLQWAMVFGQVWALVDKPSEFVESMDEEMEIGLPFVRLYFPFDVLDGGLDEMGNLKWLLVRDLIRDDDDPMSASPSVPHYTLWDRAGWRVFIRNTAGSKEDQKARPFIELPELGGTHDLGIVPFRALKFTESDDAFVTPGLLDDIAHLDRDIFNKQSQLDTIIYDQTFSQLAMPADAVILNSVERAEGSENSAAIETSRETTRQRIIEMGTKRVFLFNGNTQHPPRYLSPDASQAQTIRSTIKDNIDEIYRLAGLLGEVGREVKTQSGVSKAYDFDRLNKALTFAAQELEQMEQWIAQVVELWMATGEPQPIDEGLVGYPRDFDIMGLLEELDIAVRTDEYDLHSPSAEGELRKRLIKRLFPALPETALKAMMGEVDKATKRSKEAFERGPLQPPPPTPTGEPRPSEVRGAGGGARQPGEGPPIRPTVQHANAAEADQEG
jgi:hypothetical protein